MERKPKLELAIYHFGRIRVVDFNASRNGRRLMVRTLFDRLFPFERASRGAILYEHREITYAELRDETMRVAEVLHGLDIQVGDRVAILLADSPEFIASFVAIISLGAIAV